MANSIGFSLYESALGLSGMVCGAGGILYGLLGSEHHPAEWVVGGAVAIYAGVKTFRQAGREITSPESSRRSQAPSSRHSVTAPSSTPWVNYVAPDGTTSVQPPASGPMPREHMEPGVRYVGPDGATYRKHDARPMGTPDSVRPPEESQRPSFILSQEELARRFTKLNQG
ncbi:MAG: hypothetical protein WDO70_02430 [Alphaproteobacteria bacterium]